MKYKAVFLENDGTITSEIDKNTQTPAIELNDDVVEGLQRLQSYGYLLVVVSYRNGLVESASSVDKGQLKHQLFDSFAHLGIYLDGFYYSKQSSSGAIPEFTPGHEHSKPMPGLILRAGDEMDIDLSQSWMVGDVLDDVEAGNRAGCKSIMINKGNETKWLSGDHRLPEYFAGGLAEASKYIVATEKMRKVEQQMTEANNATAQLH